MTGLEHWLATQTAELVGMTTESLNRTARFHELGLDSLLCKQLVERLRQHLQRPIRTTLPWQYPSVRLLCQRLLQEDSCDEAMLALEKRTPDEPIAIIGMSCRLPGSANSPAAFADLLREGRDSNQPIPSTRWSSQDWCTTTRDVAGKMNTDRGCFLDNVDQFDPLFWGISPREAQVMDPQQRLFLELAWEALEDANLVPASLRNSNTGVFAGVMWSDYASLGWSHPDGVAQHTLAGGETSIVPARVAYALGLRGPCMTINTACSGSLIAVHQACSALRNGETDLACAGGVNLMLAPYNGVALAKFGGLAPDGRCKSFAASADGYGRGEGGAMVVLKLLSRALADGDQILAQIRGSATNNDGASNGLTAPCPIAQRQVIASAWSRAGLDPSTCTYVEAHGTGTPLGDPIEAEALSQVLSRGRDQATPLRMGSAKTNIGHLEAAAGIAGLVKVVLSLQQRTLFPSLHFHAPNPDIAFDELKLQVQTQLEPWPESPLLAGLSSFGIGGSNCHMVLSAAPGETTQSVSATQSSGKGPARVAFVYSGCGSQWQGMAQQLLHREPVFRAQIQRCDALFMNLLGFSVMDELCAPIQHSQMDQTAVGQILTFCMQVGLTELLRDWGIVPQVTLGQSIGDAAAAYASGALSLEDAAYAMMGFTELARANDGRGAMIVMACSAPEAETLIAAYPGKLSIASYLSHSSTAVSGDPDALARISENCRERAIRTMKVNINYACHSSLMEPLLDRVRPHLERIQGGPAHTPWYSTVEDNWVNQAQNAATYWSRNYCQPVRLMHAIEALQAQTRTLFVEVSPHPLLLKSIKQTLEVGNTWDSTVIATLFRDESARDHLRSCLTSLEAEGLEPNWSRFENRPAADLSFRLIPLGLHSPAALNQRSQDLKLMMACKDVSVSALAQTLAKGRSQLKYRRAHVVSSREQLCTELGTLESGFNGNPDFEPGPLAMLFTGQGSQYAQMGATLYRTHQVFRETLDACARVLDPLLERPLLKLLFASPDSEDAHRLQHTRCAQPAIFALELATSHLWRAWGVIPDAVLGHSVGELAAACYAGVFSLEDGCRLVAARGRLMGSLPEGGAMCCISTSEAEATTRIASFPQTLAIAAINTDRQVVLSGLRTDLQTVVKRYEQEGATCTWLKVSHAFHSPLMDPILADFAEVARRVTYKQPSLRLVTTLAGSALSGVSCPEYWVEHLRQPVAFNQAAHELIDGGFNRFIEVGPKSSLLGMIAAQFEGQQAQLWPSLSPNDINGKLILESLARFYVTGGDPDWNAFYGETPWQRVSLPSYPFQRQRYWLTLPKPPSRLGRAGHPLLGQRTRLARRREVIYHIQVEQLRDALEHAPGCIVNLIEMVTVVSGELLASPFCLEQLSFGESAFAAMGASTLQVICTPEAQQRWSFEVVAVSANPSGQEDALLLSGHCAGTQAPDATALNLESLRKNLAAIASPQLGEPQDAFSLTDCSGDEHQILGLIQINGEIDGYQLHPYHLQAALLLAQLNLIEADEQDLHPLDCALTTLYQKGLTRLWCHVQRTATPDGINAVITFYDTQGVAIARLEGLSLAWRQKSETIAELVHATQWMAAPEEHADMPLDADGGEWLIIGSGEPFDHELVEQLSARGARCHLSHQDPGLLSDAHQIEVFNDGLADAQASAYHELLSHNIKPRGIIFCGGLACNLNDLEQHRFETIFEKGCSNLLKLVQNVTREGTTPMIIVVTRGSQPVLPSDTLSGLAQTPLWGLARVIALEHPELRCHNIDLDPGMPQGELAWLAQTALRMVDSKDREHLLAYRQTQRYVPRIVAIPQISNDAATIQADATYLITGGLGELGLSLALHLAKRGARHLMLTSRSGPRPEHESALATLRAMGVQVSALRADITQSDSLDQILAEIEPGSPLRGVIHAAGQIEDGTLARLLPETLRQVLGPKFVGAWYLHQATRHLELDFFVMFSSIASVLGSAGQGSYTAANAFLDGLGHFRSTQNLPGTSINWGAFQGKGMAAAGGDATWRARGLNAFSDQTAWQFLDQVACSGQAQLQFARLSNPAFQQDWTASALFDHLRPAAESVPTLSLAQILDQTAAGERPRVLASHIRGQVLRVLGMGEADQLERRRGFATFGLDSLLAVELRNRLQHSLACPLPATLLFDYPNLESLEKYLQERVLATPVQPVSQANRNPEIVLSMSWNLTENSPDPNLELDDEDLDDMIDAEFAELDKLELFGNMDA